MELVEVEDELRLLDNITYNFGAKVEKGKVNEIQYYILDTGEKCADIWVECEDGTYTCIGTEEIISIIKEKKNDK